LTLSSAIEKVKPIVVQILSERHVLGTGFFVNEEGFVLTAKHVIDMAFKMEKIHGFRALVGLALPNTERMRACFTLVDFDIVDIDSRHDIALLRLKRNPFKGEVTSGIVISSKDSGKKELSLLFGVPTFNLNRPKEGTFIAISGYPLNETVLVTNSGGLATCWGVDVKEVPVLGAPFSFVIPDISDVYLGDIEINSGDSGAPVYEVDNSTVIGICVASKPANVHDQNNNPIKLDDGRIIFYSSGLTIIVPTKYILELLKNNVADFKTK
jgi:hypothetical protein